MISYQTDIRVKGGPYGYALRVQASSEGYEGDEDKCFYTMCYVNLKPTAQDWKVCNLLLTLTEGTK